MGTFDEHHWGISASAISLLDHFVQGTHPAELVVGLAPDLRDRDALVGMLEERPRIQVSHLDRSSRGVRVRLARAQGARDSHERALRELATLEPAAAESGPPPDPVASPAAATAAPVRGRQPGHVPVWLRAGLVALGGVIVMIALVLVGHRAWGRDGVVVALLVGLLLGQAMTMLGVLYAIRLARHGRADQRELRRALVNRTDRLRRIARRSVNQSRRGRQELAQAQLKIERLQREITALERFQSRARIQSREEG